MRHMLPFLLIAIATVPASGQALKGHNARADVFFEADRIEVQDRADRVVVSGNVRVNQAGLSLTAQRLTVAYENNGGTNVAIQRLDATGGVTVKSAGETATGDIAIYDLPRRLITMVGGVTLVQGTNRLNGGRIVINLETGVASVDGRSAGSAPVIEGGTGGRVSGKFTVTQRPN